MPGVELIADDLLRRDRLGPAAHLLLARKARRNALDAALLAALDAAVGEAVAAGECALVLDADGEVFCAGMDFAALTATDAPSRPLHETFARLLRRLDEAPLLSIALVDGEALGGGLALAAACDVVVATPAARFGLPEALWGLVPANAAPYIARRTGVRAARTLALTTESIDAQTALRLGLVDHLAEDRRAALGVVRRLCLRASRVGAEGLAAVRQCFARLDGAPADYAAWALEAISAATDAPEARARLGAAARDGGAP